MEVILLQKVDKLGDLGDKVNVKSGYGRNFLVPSGRAVTATPENLADFEKRRVELERVAAESLAQAETRLATLEGRVVTIARKSSEEGKLFGSVGTSDIAEALSESGDPVEKHEVRLPEGVFRQTGEFAVMVHLHSDVNANITVSVVAE